MWLYQSVRCQSTQISIMTSFIHYTVAISLYLHFIYCFKILINSLTIIVTYFPSFGTLFFYPFFWTFSFAFPLLTLLGFDHILTAIATGFGTFFYCPQFGTFAFFEPLLALFFLGYIFATYKIPFNLHLQNGK